MHDIEPYYAWRDLYIASEDQLSPFFKRQYSEIDFTHSIYNHLIHPQWDEIGSSTLFIKIIFTDYTQQFTIIELIGEWNDYLYNDIMYLKRNIIDKQIEQGINKFILIGENILNYHSSDPDYYEEWYDDIEDGWIACINFREHVRREFEQANIDFYLGFGGLFNDFDWRTFEPYQLFNKIERTISNRLNP